EEDGGADGSYYSVGGGEASCAPELAASSIEGGHVDDGHIAERVDDGISAAAASAGVSEEFEHDGSEERVAGANREQIEGRSDEVRRRTEWPRSEERRVGKEV